VGFLGNKANIKKLLKMALDGLKDGQMDGQKA
jgi:hypothetical protein